MGKFRGHETFYIRKGWLYKGLKTVESNSTIFSDRAINPADIFGMGVNMIKSLRYWLQAVGLTTEERRGYTYQLLTPMGELIFNHDKYMEEIGTLCLLHYKLATNEDYATSWYYFFNEFNLHEFTKEDFNDSLATHLKFKQEEVATKTLDDDFTCILNTYIPKFSDDPEDNKECPLSELGLITSINEKKNIYKKSAPKDGLIPLHILLGIIIDQNPDKKEIRIADLLKEKLNIGKIFNLDIITLTSYLDKMQLAGLIQVVRTAGLDIIKILNDDTFEDCIKNYYKSIQN